jgi:hypothetical protein
MQVWVLRNANGKFRAKFHHRDSNNCNGRRAHDERWPDKDDYILVDILDLPPSQKACQFPCCFCGLPDQAAVATRHGMADRPPR